MVCCLLFASSSVVDRLPLVQMERKAINGRLRQEERKFQHPPAGFRRAKVAHVTKGGDFVASGVRT